MVHYKPTNFCSFSHIYLSFVDYYIKLGVCEVNVKILTTVLYLRPKSDRGKKSLDNGDEIVVNLKDLVEISCRRKLHMAEEMRDEGVF